MIKKSAHIPRGSKGEHLILSLPGAQQFYRPTWVEISKNSFLENIKTIQSVLRSGIKILAVVKANAYGHMAGPLARAAEKNVSMFGVSSIEEGIALKKAGIKKAILIMGSIYPLENLQETAKQGLIPTISSLNGILRLSQIALKMKKVLPFHLKIDAGMGRIGISPKNSAKLLDTLKGLKNIRMEGMYMHFASAGTDPAFTKHQLEEFRKPLAYAEKLGLKFTAHAANSDALFLYPESHFEMVRPGISLYGLWPYDSRETSIELKPVLSWKTKIIYLKNVEEGNSISYGRTFVTKRKSVIATLPVGYADGYFRNLSNHADVLIKGKRCPVIGRVTMDMIMVDVSDVEKAAIGDEVVLIGKQGEEEITARELAEKSGTINYEIVCSISYRVPRVIV